MKQAKIDTIVEPAVGQIYETHRTGERLQIVYIDDEVILLRCEDSGRNNNSSHRLERRVAFEQKIEAGQFEYKPDCDIELVDSEEQDWSEVSYVGEKTSDNLKEAGYETNLDIQQAEDVDLLNVDGVGQSGLQNLREFAR